MAGFFLDLFCEFVAISSLRKIIMDYLGFCPHVRSSRENYYWLCGSSALLDPEGPKYIKNHIFQMTGRCYHKCNIKITCPTLQDCKIRSCWHATHVHSSLIDSKFKEHNIILSHFEKQYKDSYNIFQQSKIIFQENCLDIERRKNYLT